MAIKAQNQVTILDITDAYSVVLSNENQTFMEQASGEGAAATTTNITVYSYRGSTNVYSFIPSTAIGSSHANTDGVYITVSTNPAQELSITVHIPEGLDTEGQFSYSVAKYGDAGQPGVPPIIYELEYTGTIFNFDNETGQFLAPSSIQITASSQQGTSPKQAYTGGTITVTPYTATGSAGQAQSHSTSVTITPSVTAGEPDYLYYIATLSVNNALVDRQTIGMNRQGADGESAYAIDITSLNGFIFKNTAISTTLTAHVYCGGLEFNNNNYNDTTGHYGFGTQDAPLYVNWYKDNIGVATGINYVVNSQNVQSLATFTARLEDTKWSANN